MSLFEHIQPLLGCAWGWRIAHPTDTEKCLNRAVRIVVLHDGPEDTTGVAVKLCAEHLEKVFEYTDTRTAPHD